MVYQASHVLQENSFWGLPGGATVEVLYVYLDKIDAWHSQLTDKVVLDELELGDLGMFPHFPSYKTIGENIRPPWNLTELTAQQVNLLADLTCWVVRNSGVKEFIG